MSGRPPLRIGVLECDHVDEQYRTLTDDYAGLFRALFAPHRADLELVAYDVVRGAWPADVDACDGYLATGSRRSAYDDVAWIRELESFVRDAHAHQVPFVGICFGHQVLAQALGGRVARSDRGWGAGIRSMAVHDRATWMEPSQPEVGLHFMHQDQVVDLPDDAVHLGSTDHCPIAMFSVGRSVGLQAHPEFGDAYAGALTQARELRMGPDVAADALATLARDTDEALMATWLTGFYRSG